ncbi:MAG: hypothetical protein P4N60_04465 [Verrucomicrobiae bacterium]|nr:hypothetical protein [Verrucomicrobiae bacterium]
MTAGPMDVMLRPGMQLKDKLELAAGLLWGLFTLYGIALFLPPLTRRIRAWEVRRKPAAGCRLTRSASCSFC